MTAAANHAERGHVLKRFVDALIQSLPEKKQSSARVAEEDSFGLVYLGNVHDAIPRLLILDPGLKLEERCLWQIMRVNITNPAQPTTLLTQCQLAKLAAVDVKTVRRYLHALRAARWITGCALVRNRGTIWALHDEPLSVADTLILDPAYLQFIEQCARHTQKRLRELGRGVQDSLTQEVQKGGDYSQPRMSLDQMALRLDALEGQPRKRSASDFFALRCPEHTREVIHSRANFPMDDLTGKFALPHFSKENLSCSSNKLNINNKTTTTALEKFSRQDKAGYAWLDNLRWPKALTAQERTQVKPALAAHDPENAQYLLDYLSDRLQAARNRCAAPVPNPVAYLIRISAMHRQGELLPSSWGLREKHRPESGSKQSAANGSEILDKSAGMAWIEKAKLSLKSSVVSDNACF